MNILEVMNILLSPQRNDEAHYDNVIIFILSLGKVDGCYHTSSYQSLLKEVYTRKNKLMDAPAQIYNVDKTGLAYEHRPLSINLELHNCTVTSTLVGSISVHCVFFCFIRVYQWQCIQSQWLKECYSPYNNRHCSLK